MRSVFILLLSFIMIAAPATTRNGEQKQVWVFYLGFWAGEKTWEWNADLLDDYPLIGLYNAKMPEVALTQIMQAHQTGIDAFLVSWFGIDDIVTTTPTLINMLDRAAELDFKIGAVIDVFVEGFNRDYDSLSRSLAWLMTEGIQHPAYLQYDGKPIIFFAFQDKAELSPQDWLALRQTYDPDRRTLWIAEGLNGCCLYDGAMDGMYAFNLAWANGRSSVYRSQQQTAYHEGATLFIPTISPGWDEDAVATLTNRPNPTSPRARNNGQFMIDAWHAALQTGSDVILVVTWNEFIENSHIEPSQNFGMDYLKHLRMLIIDWKGSEPPAITQLPAGYSLRATAAVTAYALPDRDAAVIGVLTPHTSYTIVDEDNGFYGVTFEGNTIGYVSALATRIIAD